MEVRTEVFEASHGRSPRGYGGWGFSWKRNPQSNEVFWHTGKYSDARKSAVAWAVTKGWPQVYVQP